MPPVWVPWGVWTVRPVTFPGTARQTPPLCTPWKASLWVLAGVWAGLFPGSCRCAAPCRCHGTCQRCEEAGAIEGRRGWKEAPQKRGKKHGKAKDRTQNTTPMDKQLLSSKIHEHGHFRVMALRRPFFIWGCISPVNNTSDLHTYIRHSTGPRKPFTVLLLVIAGFPPRPPRSPPLPSPPQQLSPPLVRPRARPASVPGPRLCAASTRRSIRSSPFPGAPSTASLAETAR